MAFGVIEDRYNEKMSIDDALDIAIRALSSAMKRDSASGNEIHVIKITKDGYIEVGKDELQARKTKLGLEN